MLGLSRGNRAETRGNCKIPKNKFVKINCEFNKSKVCNNLGLDNENVKVESMLNLLKIIDD